MLEQVRENKRQQNWQIVSNQKCDANQAQDFEKNYQAKARIWKTAKATSQPPW